MDQLLNQFSRYQQIPAFLFIFTAPCSLITKLSTPALAQQSAISLITLIRQSRLIYVRQSPELGDSIRSPQPWPRISWKGRSLFHFAWNLHQRKLFFLFQCRVWTRHETCDASKIKMVKRLKKIYHRFNKKISEFTKKYFYIITNDIIKLRLNLIFRRGGSSSKLELVEQI